MADPQAYKVGTPGGGTGTIKGSEKLFTKHPEMLKRFISKSGNTLTIAKKAPGGWKVPAILAALGVTYIGNKIIKWLDKRTGKTGGIPTQLQGKKTPKQLKGKHTGKYDKKQRQGPPTKKQTKPPTTLAKAKAAESIRLARKKIDEEGTDATSFMLDTSDQNKGKEPPTPPYLKMVKGGKVYKKTYAKGGGIRRASRYS